MNSVESQRRRLRQVLKGQIIFAQNRVRPCSISEVEARIRVQLDSVGEDLDSLFAVVDRLVLTPLSPSSETRVEMLHSFGFGSR